ncbi:transmembrane amino acid transporter protein-domain-containing protein [Xylariaceae sp. FL0594]|nr:transmembrane amino acid transporter protein-domain-containing protein [Xylariaceae sp. FL0594]
MFSDKEKDAADLAPTYSRETNDVGDINNQTTDAVFGEISEDGPNYRNVGWIATSVLMMKTQIGLGVLSIPSALDTLGYIPGILSIVALAIITGWSAYMVGAFKLRHPAVYGIDDTGALIFGKAGRIFFFGAFVLFWVFVGGSGMLGISISLNAISTHGACTAVFVAVAAVAGFLGGSIQTMSRISWLAWVGLAGILVALFTVTIAVGVQDRPASAPQEGPWKPDFKLFASPSFAEAVAAEASLVFAFCGTTAFFAIISEMRDPRLFTRSLVVCQSAVTATYIVVGTVIYYYCGSYVASPALGSAGVLVKKIAYGISLPGLLATTILSLHILGKFIFVRSLSGSRHLSSNTVIHWVTWLGCVGGATLTSYVIASAIPVFGELVSLIGALLGTLMSFQPMGCMWLYDNWTPRGGERNKRWYFMAAFSIFVIVSGTFLMVSGTYGSVVAIINSYNASGGSAAWSCADNSNSV